MFRKSTWGRRSVLPFPSPSPSPLPPPSVTPSTFHPSGPPVYLLGTARGGGGGGAGGEALLAAGTNFTAILANP